MFYRLITNTSPVALLSAGLAAGIVASPVLRKCLRGAAVKTVKIGLAVSGSAKNIGNTVSDGYQGIVTEAKTMQESTGKSESNTCLKNTVKDKLHATGVAAVKGGLTVMDQMKEVSDDVKNKWNFLVVEARGSEAMTETTPVQEAAETLIDEKPEQPEE